MIWWLFRLGDSTQIAPDIAGVEFTLPAEKPDFTLVTNRLHFTLAASRLHFTLEDE